MVDKFLVIGSNSFSGSHFVNFLLDKDLEVYGVSRSNEPLDVFLPYKWNMRSPKNLNFTKMDLNKDLDELINLIKSNNINYIINFASQGMVAESWKSPEDWYLTNVVSQVKLHNELRQLDFIDKYIHISTPEVYGNNEGWVKENFNFSPSTPYAVSRASCDLHLKSFYNAYNFPVIFTRASNVFGPGQQLYRIVPRTIIASKTKNKLELHGGGTSRRSFIHIDDVVNATFKILIDGQLGETYHISTNELVSIKELVKMICEITNVNFDDVVNISEERLAKDDTYQLDSSKIRNEFNWFEKKSLQNGITETVDWLINHLDILKKLPIKYEHKI